MGIVQLVDVIFYCKISKSCLQPAESKFREDFTTLLATFSKAFNVDVLSIIPLSFIFFLDAKITEGWDLFLYCYANWRITCYETLKKDCGNALDWDEL